MFPGTKILNEILRRKGASHRERWGPGTRLSLHGVPGGIVDSLPKRETLQQCPNIIARCAPNPALQLTFRSFDSIRGAIQ
jgi:hypothetical protein